MPAPLRADSPERAAPAPLRAGLPEREALAPLRARLPDRVAPAPPRLWRAVAAQLLALGAIAALADLPWPSREPQKAEPPPRAQPVERRVRIIRIAKPHVQPKKPPEPRARSSPPQPVQRAQAPAQQPPALQPPAPQPPAPQPTARSDRLEPRKAQAAARPQPQRSQAQKPSSVAPTSATPPSERPRAQIAADATAVHGVRLRVLVPRSAAELASHLRLSGGCLVVSRLLGGGAEVLSALALDGSRAVASQGPPCDGVPRLLRDASLNDELGDPVGRVRDGLPAAERNGELVLQVLLSPELTAQAQSALLARFGPVSQEEMGRRAAEAGYELACFAEPSGGLRCR